MSSLEIGIIGNCTIAALIDREARIVWSCFPRLDGDPVFSRLIDNDRPRGDCVIELEGMVRSEQEYVRHTAVLVTRLIDADGDGIEITDFCPRFMHFGRMFHPTTIVRIVKRFGKTPRIRVRMRPHFGYGSEEPLITRGSNHIRYVGTEQNLRLTTNAPVTYILDETTFRVEDELVFMLGPDESLRGPVKETGREFLEQTLGYWRSLTMRLHVPFEWQEAVVRSAITLKLCSFEETGGIVAAMTTSLPEADGEGRNWDYRFCWLRDSLFVVRTLNRLGYIETMEKYLEYINNIVSHSADGFLQPVFGIALEEKLIEHEVNTLAGYRGNRPVRRGNQAYEHHQHDGYGSVVLAAAQAFFDTRLHRPAGIHTFRRLERVGEQAWRVHDVPDAGLWELRTKAKVHTHSSVMCWAACDRLARIAQHLGVDDRATYWRERADIIHAKINEQAFDPELNSYVSTFGGKDMDAALLLLHEVGFVKGDDPRFVGTVERIKQELKVGAYVYRYKAEDDFGAPRHAFLVCSFWYIDALIAIGQRDEARAMFEEILGRRNALGLLSEHVDIDDGEMWGNFPQTYSHVGLIHCAMRLSKSWEDVV